ncbi:hypothetical protein EV356DRAFT_506343 [Viridothelium virens]|uniref:Subtelomeric hrmA-associated cluster protein AFUB-079030/YDR124W-like helical bundle domain-containing protein n=1 Tax=Viridothelium virens TaxID=1048519 RepID=A0A6A6H234_VIRVR|nr:hypothetical protein EV356DRAFT_506343 [Viridothelium virens]
MQCPKKTIQDSVFPGSIFSHESSEFCSSPTDCGILDIESPLSPDAVQGRQRGLKRASKTNVLQQVPPKRMRWCEEGLLKPGTPSECTDGVTSGEEGQKAQVNSNRYISLDLRDNKKVTEYFERRLENLTQLGVKAILKKWIDRICPRKQTTHPYVASNPEWRRVHKKEHERPPVPEWWPIGQCKHKEPDHSSKKDRMHLAQHLIRLRDKGVKNWEESKESSWTNMLENSTKTVKLRYRDQDTSEDIEFRHRVLKEFYNVARHEEENLENGQHGCAFMCVTDYDVKGRKRRRGGARTKGKASKAFKKSTSRRSSEAEDNFMASPKVEEVLVDYSDAIGRRGSRATSKNTGPKIEGNPEELAEIRPHVFSNGPASHLAYGISDNVHKAGSPPPPGFPMDAHQIQVTRPPFSSLTSERFSSQHNLTLVPEYLNAPMENSPYTPNVANQRGNHCGLPWPLLTQPSTYGVSTVGSSSFPESRMPYYSNSSSISDDICASAATTFAMDSNRATSQLSASTELSMATDHFSPYVDKQYQYSLLGGDAPVSQANGHLLGDTRSHSLGANPTSPKIFMPNALPTYRHE